MGPYLLTKTIRMSEIMTDILANEGQPELDRAMLWEGFKDAPSPNRRFYEVEFAWRTPSFDETSDIIDDEDLYIVKQVVELDVYSSIFRHYLRRFAFVKHQRFDPEWLMEIVRRDLANGMLWPVQEDVIIKYGTARDIDKVAAVCVADKPYGAILTGASILAARRPDEARQFIQQQLDNRTVRTEFREVMEEILQGIGTDTEAE